MAGVPTLSEWYLLGKTAPDGYASRLDTALDLQSSLSRSTGKAFLFQFAARDHYIAADRAQAFLASAPLPKGAFWYDADHALATPKAFADRQAWLRDALSVLPEATGRGTYEELCLT